MEALGHEVFVGAGNPTCVSIRAHTRLAGQWDDQHMVIAQMPSGRYEFVAAGRGTTDASDDYLTGRRRPHPRGTAVALPGQHRGCWRVGPDALHGRSSGRPYPAFEQVAGIHYMRDNDGDNILDTPTSGYCRDEKDFAEFHRMIESTFVTGDDVLKLNWHGTRGVSPTKIGPWSAGCPVWLFDDDFDQALSFCTDAAEVYGSRVSWCLLDQWFDIS